MTRMTTERKEHMPMYDPNKHAEFTNCTVEDLKAVLAKLPHDAEILCCGDNIFHIHCEKDGSAVNIDTNSMEDEYESTKPTTVCIYGITWDDRLVVYLKLKGFQVMNIQSNGAFDADILLLPPHTLLKDADPWVRKNPSVKVWTPAQLMVAYGLTDDMITAELAKEYKASKPKMVKVVLRPKRPSRLRLPRKVKAQAQSPYCPPCCPMTYAPDPMAQAYREACVEDFCD